jgi:hypothetical protein
VLTEVLFGASAAWQAPISNSSSSSSAPGYDQQQQQQVALTDSGYEAVLLQVLSAATQPRLWGLPTSQAGPAADAAAAADDQASRQQLPAQVQNHLLFCLKTQHQLQSRRMVLHHGVSVLKQHFCCYLRHQ